MTGYIAGDALYALQEKHPELEYAALVRTQEKADRVLAAYPKIRIVLGGLDDSQLIEDETAKADIVLHAADASDHEGAAQAITRGLAKRKSDRPGYWLHTGGTGILTYQDSDANRLGEWSDKEYNDWAGVKELTSLPDHAFHRNVDKIVLSAAAKHSDHVKVALICPPTIHGKGRGPVSGRGRQVYELAKLIMQKQYAPIIGQGKARWNHIHVADLSDVYVSLVEAAIAGKHDQGTWGPEAYYLTERGEHVWGDLAKEIAKYAAEHGFIKKDWQETALSKDEAMDVAGFEAVSWGWNSRGKAERAQRLLGWKPSRQSITDEIPNILREESSRMKSV